MSKERLRRTAVRVNGGHAEHQLQSWIWKYKMVACCEVEKKEA
jgi:hypothetical protein